MGKCFSKSKEPDTGTLKLKHFDILRSVGRGAFGKVRIVRKKTDKKLYAMKYINKEKCISQNAVKNTLFERNLLEQIEHPFIVNLRFAFQDDENMFMVMDLMLGGDLKFHLQHTGAFAEEVVRFYAIEISSALIYLHSQGIVHRDIKPDNLLLDKDGKAAFALSPTWGINSLPACLGHVHLTDFNVAAYLPTDGKQLRSFSGTLSYMAPEVIGKQGYREEPDWWSLGVLLYELLFGKRPFRGYSSKELANKIVHGVYQFPSTANSVQNELLDFITRLLEKDPKKRLGAGEIGLQRLKSHPLMKEVDWNDVCDKKLDPPFVPDPERPNFDAMFEAEDILLEDNPLRPNRSRSKKETQDPNVLLISAQYTDFNYQLRETMEKTCNSIGKEKLLEQSQKLEVEKDNVGLESIPSKNLSLLKDREEHEDKEIAAEEPESEGPDEP